MANKYNITDKETQPKTYSHINGSLEETIARYQITELCKGWPVYRDASEWNNYRSLFTDDAYVFTTWSGGLQIDDFIDVSKKGRARGDQIMHRENGTLADVDLAKGRGIGKMKATITQRLTFPNCQIDVECDSKFIFFCKKVGSEWKTQWVKLFYEKDKIVPVDGKTTIDIQKSELEQYPEGYQYLSVCQSKLGHKILKDLPTMSNEAFYRLYEAMDQWMEGKDIDLRWETGSGKALADVNGGQ